MKKKLFTLAGMAALGLLGTAASADIIVIDIGNMPTGGAVTADVVLQNVLGPNAHVIGLGFDVTLETFAASWASEAVLDFGSTVAPFVSVTPGLSTNTPLASPTTYSSGGIVDLIGLGLDFHLEADGVLITTLRESFDDGIPSPDGMWLGGSTITVEYFVPSPGSLALLGLAGLTARRRRRRA